MTHLDGYVLSEQLHNGNRFIVHRAKQLDPPRSCVIKLHAKRYPSVAEITKLRQEFELGRQLHLPGVLEYFALEKHENGLALIMEDVQGISLSALISGRPMPADEILAIAIAICTILEGVHASGVIHKDIKPHNIVLSPSNGDVRLIDFGIATQLNCERQKPTSARMLEGTLTHIPPEQTGRINRVIDHRSDLYALGVTLYEMATGRLPFSAQDPLELLYCHLAKAPEAPHSVNEAVPIALSDIIMRLMAKTPEERYQSAAGLRADLERCRDHLSGKLPVFRPLVDDGRDRFQIPQRLYGRSAELSELLAAFDRIAAGSTELLLVSGYSGIGKSSLVHELHRPILARRGNFVSGKFDQYKRDIPYASFVTAIQELIKHVLAEGSDTVARWRDRLRAMLEGNGKVMIDVIPEVELIIGPQPEPPQLTGAAAKRRFNDVLRRFVRAFAAPEHPLVLFLDDLQWADPGTLSLLHLLMTDPEIRCFLLIGAYRDNEVDPLHPMTVAVEDARSAGARISELVLKPFAPLDLTDLIADTVRRPVTDVQDLVEVIDQKTRGNPFFVTQLLSSLHHDGLIFFDATRGEWRWDREQIDNRAISANVVDLMSQRIKTLSPESQGVLTLAACIGSAFDLRTLAVVHGASLSQTAATLWPALKEGLVLPSSESYRLALLCDVDSADEALRRMAEASSYRFLHDRVQQAAYSLVPRDRLASLHLQIGRLWLEGSIATRIEGDLFEIVKHFNSGRELLKTPEERRSVARLNLRAALKAKRNSAFAAELQYASLSTTYLSEDSWTADYDLTMACHMEQADAHFLNGLYREALDALAVAEMHVDGLLDECRICELKVLLLKMLNDLNAAFDTGAKVLEKLGITLDRYPTPASLDAELGATKAAIAGRTIEALGNLPEMTDPEKIAACRILQEIWPVGFFLGSLGMHVAAMRIVQLSARYGTARTSVFGYMVYGFALVFVFDDIEAGHTMGQLSLMLHERFQTREVETKILDMWGGLIQHYKQHIRAGKDTLWRGFTRGLEIGDYQWAGYCAMNFVHLSIVGDTNLEDAIAVIDRVLPTLRKYDQNMTNTTLIAREAVASLLARREDPTRLVGEWCDETETLRYGLDNNEKYTLFIVYFYKLLLALVYDVEDSLAELQARAEETVSGCAGIWINPVFYYLEALAVLTIHSRASESERAAHLAIVRRNLAKLNTWMQHAPENFTHMHALVEAELMRVEGRHDEAMRLYDMAIASARAGGFIHDQAIAAERASKAFRARGSSGVADVYLREARYCYQRWGALGKVHKISAEFPNLDATLDKLSSTRGTTSELELDAFAVVKASQALAGVLVLDELMGVLMRTLLETAGAERGFLILPRPTGELVIEVATLGRDLAPTPLPLDSCPHLPRQIVHYAANSRTTVLLDDAARAPQFIGDEYIARTKPKSVLGLPIVHLGNLAAVAYLENNQVAGAFTMQRVRVLEILAAQAGVSLQNARLYDELEQRVQIRTSELRQAQEKMTDLALAAGRAEVAVNVIHNVGNILSSLTTAVTLLQEGMNVMSAAPFTRLADLVTQHENDLAGFLSREPGKLVPSYLKALAERHEKTHRDCVEDLARLRLGLDRILETIEGQQGYVSGARLLRPVDLSREIDDALRLYERDFQRMEVKVHRQYADVGPLLVEQHKLRMILSNLVSNAFHSLEASTGSRALILDLRKRLEEQVEIEVTDTGLGISAENMPRLFEQGFTTKPQGHGLGLHYCINTAREMGGDLRVASDGCGKGASFTLILPTRA